MCCAAQRGPQASLCWQGPVGACGLGCFCALFWLLLRAVEGPVTLTPNPRKGISLICQQRQCRRLGMRSRGRSGTAHSTPNTGSGKGTGCTASRVDLQCRASPPHPELIQALHTACRALQHTAQAAARSLLASAIRLLSVRLDAGTVVGPLRRAARKAVQPHNKVSLITSMHSLSQG